MGNKGALVNVRRLIGVMEMNRAGRITELLAKRTEIDRELKQIADEVKAERKALLANRKPRKKGNTDALQTK
jgi:hypothetical protein